MRLFPLALLLLLISCQDVRRGPAASDWDIQQGAYSNEQTELSKHVKSFYGKMGAAGFNNSPRNIKYVFSHSMDIKYAGYCDAPVGPGAPPTITINMTYWSAYTTTEKEILVFHEMGHCVLNRPHISKTDSRGVAISLMHPILMYAGDYRQKKSYYINELFANAGIPKGGTGHQAAKSFQVEESFDVHSDVATHKCR